MALLTHFHFLPSYQRIPSSQQTTVLHSHYSAMFTSKRLRFSVIALLVVLLITFAVLHSHSLPSLPVGEFPDSLTGLTPGSGSHLSEVECANSGIDWSQFAYTQYVTNAAYLCNSVMLFEILHRLGSKADRLMMYPEGFAADENSDKLESRLLLKAKNEYNVKLQPIRVQRRPGGDGMSFSYGP